MRRIFMVRKGRGRHSFALATVSGEVHRSWARIAFAYETEHTRRIARRLYGWSEPGVAGAAVRSRAGHGFLCEGCGRALRGGESILGGTPRPARETGGSREA